MSGGEYTYVGQIVSDTREDEDTLIVRNGLALNAYTGTDRRIVLAADAGSLDAARLASLAGDDLDRIARDPYLCLPLEALQENVTYKQFAPYQRGHAVHDDEHAAIACPYGDTVRLDKNDPVERLMWLIWAQSPVVDSLATGAQTAAHVMRTSADVPRFAALYQRAVYESVRRSILGVEQSITATFDENR